jgi:hypothetical protein
VPKTAPPAEVKVPGISTPFRASAVPDAFDERDLVYQPRLQPLPAELDVRPTDKSQHYVMTQQGSSCTGHAVASMINVVLARNVQLGFAEQVATTSGRTKDFRVSPYMLYAMARRYDEFAGEEDEGSSLRGALKGWYYHGVLPESAWPALDPKKAPDIDDPEVADLAMRQPLGAFYRVTPFRLDDMQSAVNELHAIAVSAAVHDGWTSPTVVTRKAPGSNKVSHMAVIERRPRSQPLGGHAFAIVGYNEVGFLVQNSWGTRWGRGGFATLPYDDWLASAYDAWVARPGVRSIVSQRSHTRTVSSTSGEVAEGPGPDLARLDRHVVNLGNDGRLSTTGRFSSTPRQIDRIFARMADYHDHWAANPVGRANDGQAPRRIVIYAHGGLNSEKTGLTIAWKQLNWWLNNRVYPITFAWQSGPSETLVDQLSDLTHGRLPAGGLGFDLVEQFDRLVEKIARSSARWMWDEMKENAAKASLPFAPSKAKWPVPATGAARQAMADLPGASLTASRLAAYVAASPDPVEVHLVGHSAGSIFLATMLERLSEVPVASLSFLAPAIRVDTFLDQVVPHLRSGHVERLVTFGLDGKRELDDVCAAGNRKIYQKSLLYLVSRALERPSKGQGEVPLLGMERFEDVEVHGTTASKAVHDVGGAFAWSPTERPANSRTDSTSHGGFDDDSPTMTSVMLRVLGLSSASEASTFQPYAQRREAEPPEPGTPAGQAPALATAEVDERGRTPTTKVAAAGPRPAPAPQALDDTSANPTVAALQRDGWSTS